MKIDFLGFVFFVLCAGLSFAEAEDVRVRPGEWEIHTRGGEVLAAASIRTDEDSLLLEREGATRLSEAEAGFVLFRPERKLLRGEVERTPAEVDSKPIEWADLEEGIVWDGRAQLNLPVRLPEETSLRLRFRITQEQGVGWHFTARRLTRTQTGTSERPELTMRQSSEGLDIRDLGSRWNRRVRVDAPEEGRTVEYEVLMNWEPPAFAVWREGVPIYTSELPGVDGQDSWRELIFRFPEGVQTSLSQVELSLADGQLPELRRPEDDPEATTPGKTRIFFLNQDVMDVVELLWEEERISFRLTEDGPQIRMPLARVRMVLYGEGSVE